MIGMTVRFKELKITRDGVTTRIRVGGDHHRITFYPDDRGRVHQILREQLPDEAAPHIGDMASRICGALRKVRVRM